MKRINTLLLLASLTLAACIDGNDFGDDYVPGMQSKRVPYSLELSTSSVSLSHEVQTTSITVTSNSSKWTATSSEQWCTVSPSTNALSVSVTENTGATRQATITVKAGDKQKTTTVTQEGLTLNVSPTSLAFTPNSGNKTLTVTSNYEWTASSTSSWCTVSRNGNSLTVTVAENTSKDSRQATIKVTVGEIKQEVTVTQEGITLTVSSPSTFNNEGGTQTLTVTCNANNWTPTSDKPSWCKVEKKSNTSLAVTCDPNTTTDERTATITVQAGEVTRRVTVTQKGKTAINVNPFDDDENWD